METEGSLVGLGLTKLECSLLESGMSTLERPPLLGLGLSEPKGSLVG